MKSTIFEYRDYREFLLDQIQSLPNQGRGVRKKLADFIGCQNTYISHIFAGMHDLSPEQTEATARFFGLNRKETEFFLLLVQYARASTQHLRAHLKKSLEELSDGATELKTRLKIPQTLTPDARAKYYSSWRYSAVHMALTIPELRSRDRLMEHFRVSPEQIDEVLKFLWENKLIAKEKHSFKVLVPFLHLEKASPLIQQHHSNWRTKAIHEFDSANPNCLHYSLVFTIAERDLPKVRERLTKALEECADVIKPSREEKLAALCLDLFEVR